MRTRILLAIAAVIATIALGAKMVFVPGSSSTVPALATSDTLSPHDMHLNYRAMKELPVQETKEPF
jgi:hypothetical protein